MTVDSTVFGTLGDNADAVMLFSPDKKNYNSILETYDDSDIPVVVVGKENPHDAEQFVELPLDFSNFEETLQFGVEAAMKTEHLDDGDIVVCGSSVFDDTMDTITRVKAREDLHTGLYELFMNSRADANVIRDVFNVAIDLGKKGQKGKPVGALFAVGDAGTIMNNSRPLSYNPFEKSHVHVGDPIVKTMLKEFSKLDGAFVISDSGKIVSAYRYLEPSADGVDIPKGLGARHMAGAAITKTTNATSIVLSESDGMVRGFQNGSLIIEIDPENF